MQLFRAFAYQLQPLAIRSADVQPECCVFFESHTPEAAPATLLRLLALTWGCTPADVDFYNLDSERELLRRCADEAPGDAALWVSGMYHGPLFQRLDRCLMLVRPTTLARLLRARQATLPLRDAQRRAVAAAEAAMQRQQRQRAGFMADLSRTVITHHTQA